MTLRIEGAVMGGVSVNGSRLVGHVANLTLTATLTWSLVPVANVSALNPLLEALIDYVLVPYLNKIFGEGLPLPAIGNVSFVDPEVTYAPGLITIATAFGPVGVRPLAQNLGLAESAVKKISGY